MLAELRSSTMTHRELKFSPNNAQANLEIEKYEEVFHPMIEFLRHHYISPALTMDCNVPLEYIQRAYHSAKYLKDEDKIEFMVAPATYTTLTKILLQKTLKLPKRDYYHEAPTFTQIVEMLKEIGYLGDLSGPSDFKRVNLPGIWSFLFSMLNRCITGNLGATDQAGESLLSIMWGLVKVKDIDFIDLIWEDFVATVTKNKAYVHYPRFWAIIIKKALGSAVTLTGTLPTKYVLGQFKMPSNQERWEVIPPINEEMLAIIPDNSPVLKKYTELISISKPEQTFHGSPPGRTTSSGYQQRRNPQQSSGSSDKNLPHVLSSDSSGEDLAHVLSTVSRQIEDIETSIQHPQDTAVESTCFVEPLEETPLPFDHNAHNGVIPLTVDLTNVPNNHLRFDDPMDIELDPRTDWSSDELNSVLIQRSTDHSVGSGLLFHNLEVVLGKPDTFTSVSPNLFRCASMGHIHDVTLDFDSLMIEAKQKKIGQFDVSVAAARENALSRSLPERQQQVFDITDWNSDEVNSVLIQRSTDHCMCSGLLFHNLEVVLGKPDTFTSVSPNLFRNASMGHIHDLTLDFDSLKTEAKQKKIEQRDVSARRQKRRHAKNVFKSYFRQRKNALSRRDLERQQQVFKNSISRKEFDEMKASVQELMVSVKDLLQLNLDCKKQLKEDVENYWETTEGRRIAEYDSLSEEIKGFRVHQTSFNQTLVDKISVVERKLNAISTKVDALQQEETIIPTEAISAPVQTQVPPSTSSSIIPATPLRVVPDSQISHLLTMLFNDQTESLNDKYVQFLKAVNDVPENVLIQRLAMGREIDAEKIVQAMTQFKYVVFEAYKSLYALNCKSDLLANFKFGPKVGDGTSASQPSVRKRVSGVSIIEVEPKRSKTSHDEQLSNGKGKKKSLANEDLPLPEIEDLDTTNNIVDEMQQFHEELQNGKEGIEAELKSTSEPTPEGAMKEKVVQNPDTTENIFDEVQLFDEELQNGKEGVDAEFKSTSEPTPRGALKEKVVIRSSPRRFRS